MLPVSLSSCTSLRTLVIEYMPCSWKAPVKNYFPNLTMLCLDAVEIVNESCSTDTLLFHFPVLETFEVSAKWSNVKLVEIYAPALMSLKSETWTSSEIGAYIIKIIGAGIQKFETSGGYIENFNLTAPTISSAAMRNATHLQLHEEVVKSGQRIRMLLNEFSSLMTLELSCYLTLALGHTKPGFPLSCFSKLEKLALSSSYIRPPISNVRRLIEGLLELLHSAPLLKYLDIKICGFFNENFEYGALEEIKFDHFTVETPVFPLDMFLMEHGAHLKKLSFHTSGGKKDEVAEQLTRFPKASTCLTTVIT